MTNTLLILILVAIAAPALIYAFVEATIIAGVVTIYFLFWGLAAAAVIGTVVSVILMPPTPGGWLVIPALLLSYALFYLVCRVVGLVVWYIEWCART
jgi:hypothetical protein